MSAAYHTVHLRINDADSGQPTPVRVRFTDADGTYYAPFGRLTKFPTEATVDRGGNVQIDARLYASIDGTCEIRLPVGRALTLEVNKGCEYLPLVQPVMLKAGQISLRLAIQRWADLRKDGWYSGDVFVQELTPHAALLEGRAEDVAVVNLLAERLRPDGAHDEAFPNLTAFSGQRPALEAPGHMLVVNTLNQHVAHGALALLHCHRVVYPLTLGAADEPTGLTLADWCDQCHRKGGLVVWAREPPTPADRCQSEALAALIVGKIDAFQEAPDKPEEWYRLLNAGCRVPLAGGSCKGNYGAVVGSVRTYVRLQAGEEFTYPNWIEGLRVGRTFVTNGPLLSFAVDGQDAGALLDLPAAADRVRVRAEVRSLAPVERLEVVADGRVIAAGEACGSPAMAVLEAELPVAADTLWLAARCWGQQGAAAHTSPVYLERQGQPPAPKPTAVAALKLLLQRLLAWADGEAYFDSERQRKHFVRLVLDACETLAGRTRDAPPAG